MVLIRAEEEVWPLKEVFRISRGSRTETRVVAVTLGDGDWRGRGEGVPLRRYHQTRDSVLKQIESIAQVSHLDRAKLQQLLPAGAARNALDCALWDLEAKRQGKRVWEMVDPSVIAEVETAFTISLDAPEKMSVAAKTASHLPILKLKLGGDDLDATRVESVRAAAPKCRLLVDANESWSAAHYQSVVPILVQHGVELIEQPFPADADGILESLDRPIPVCADESCHTTADLRSLKNRYDVINVKLDKTGGFTEAFRLCQTARDQGFKLLIGCMVSTSLAIAPARVLAGLAEWIDLDGALLLSRDRENALPYRGGKIGMPSRALWG